MDSPATGRTAASSHSAGVSAVGRGGRDRWSVVWFHTVSSHGRTAKPKDSGCHLRGRARDEVTFAPEGRGNIPHLLNELLPQATFCTQLINRGILGHYVATASLATGVNKSFNNFADVAPKNPTVFEYFEQAQDPDGSLIDADMGRIRLVLYCSSSGELTSARVAVALRKKGISNVWVLEGGLTAWKKEGLPVTLRLSTSAEAAERFGIKIVGDEPHVAA
jgi:rhodanese-related sulfurtransferase